MNIKSSTLLIASMLAMTVSASAHASTIFSDTFNGSDSVVGNGWVESPSYNVSRDNGALFLEGDASAKRTIDTKSVLNLTLDFDWKPLEDSANNDYLYVSWRKNSSSSWVDLFTGSNALSLGGSSSQYNHATNDITLASVTSQFQLRFWTDVHGQSEEDQNKGVYIDNVVLKSSSVPEPAMLMLLGFGLLGFEGYRRRTV